MSDNTGAPLNLEYLAPAQEEPEVIINANSDIINAFAATVGPSSDHSDVGGSITITDGTHTVADCTTLRFLNGTVADAGGGEAHYTAPSGGGGGSDGGSLANLNVDSHPSVPDDTNDEFEETSLEGAWSIINSTGSASVTLDGAGSVHMVADATSGDNNLALIKALDSPSAAWQYDFGSLFMVNGSTSGGNSSAGVAVRNSANGKFVKFGFFQSGGSSFTLLIQRLTNLTTYSSNPLATGAYPTDLFGDSSLPLYYRLKYDGSGTLTFQLSRSGRANTWSTIGTEAVGTFLGAAATDIGLIVNSSVSTGVDLYADWMRRTA
jgi:hypothetical protein